VRAFYRSKGEVATPEARISPEDSFPALRIRPAPAHQLAGARQFL
jgi:hypothetical protein